MLHWGTEGKSSLGWRELQGWEKAELTGGQMGKVASGTSSALEGEDLEGFPSDPWPKNLRVMKAENNSIYTAPESWLGLLPTSLATSLPRLLLLKGPTPRQLSPGNSVYCLTPTKLSTLGGARLGESARSCKLGQHS